MADEREHDVEDDDAEQLLNGEEHEDDDNEEDERPKGGRSDDSDRGDPSKLGDAGKKALDSMKRERNAARKERDDLRTKLKDIEDKDKSEAQRLQEAHEEAKGRAAKAEARSKALSIAMERAPQHATLAQVRAVAKRVRGDDDDELEQDADELFELLAPEPKEETKGRRVPEKPRQRLKGGSDPDEEPEENDPRKLAKLIRRD